MIRIRIIPWWNDIFKKGVVENELNFRWMVHHWAENKIKLHFSRVPSTMSEEMYQNDKSLFVCFLTLFIKTNINLFIRRQCQWRLLQYPFKNIVRILWPSNLAKFLLHNCCLHSKINLSYSQRKLSFVFIVMICLIYIYLAISASFHYES